MRGEGLDFCEGDKTNQDETREIGDRCAQCRRCLRSRSLDITQYNADGLRLWQILCQLILDVGVSPEIERETKWLFQDLPEILREFVLRMRYGILCGIHALDIIPRKHATVKKTTTRITWETATRHRRRASTLRGRTYPAAILLGHPRRRVLREKLGRIRPR